ncbi:DNA-binding transcription factor [Lithospermum erythrorhizon]|uniref:DNA-binding transcription factor n=1 Tax=Lithospermum erythrorhizon TaxID=34254 RepID=A0AAV3PXI1_LITER
MEEHLNSFAVSHLLQYTLRSLCIQKNSQWVYAVFWRILPRNYPPPKWDCQGGAYDRSRGNRRNWILVWEDGFCNFAASATEMNGGECPNEGSSSGYEYQQYQGLQPELFFKMSHEIYNYGEGLIGKVAADHSHKWIFKEPNDQQISFLSAWHNSADTQPRTWEAQFQSGIKTIALIAVREGVIQLGSVHKVIEDLSNVVMLRKKLSYIESIPGVLLPHPSSAASTTYPLCVPPEASPWHYQSPPMEYYSQCNQQQLKITPSMSSLEALLSKLPSVIPTPTQPVSSLPLYNIYCEEAQTQYLTWNRNMELMGMQKVAKEEYDNDDDDQDVERQEKDSGNQSSDSMSLLSYKHHQQNFGYVHDLNVSSTINDSY